MAEQGKILSTGRVLVNSLGELELTVDIFAVKADMTAVASVGRAVITFNMKGVQQSVGHVMRELNKRVIEAVAAYQQNMPPDENASRIHAVGPEALRLLEQGKV